MPWRWPSTSTISCIFSGDGDFRHLVEALQRKGKKVTVASTLRTQPPMIADDLRRQADHFLELSTLAETLGRDPAQRPQRPQRDRDGGRRGTRSCERFRFARPDGI